jgi:membrane associated rhomboid family serine protease
MLIPWLKGFLNWKLAPLTWTLMFLNFFVYISTMDMRPDSASREFSNVEMLVLTGRLYEQFKAEQIKNDQPATFHSQNDWLILGGQALKNPDFIENAATFEFHGDDLAIAGWREKIKVYQAELQNRASSIYGLRSSHSSPLTWVTYQFMHASWVHLFGNMMMLLMFGAAAESIAGGLVVALVYVLSGFAGAWAYLLLGSNSLAPMIGASGALSGVMAFYAAFEKKRRVSFFYFVSPLPGYFGWIYLPTVLIFPLCFLSDFAGYLSTPTEIGTGIAFAAHMGGALFGAALGFSLRAFRKNIYLQWLR